MKWGKLGSSTKNCEKLTIPGEATFKNPNFSSLCKLEKNLEVPILNIIMTWENVVLIWISLLKIRCEHKAGHISTLTWWMRYFISSKSRIYQNWLKNVFHWKISSQNVFHFEPIENSAHTTRFSTLGKALLPLYL